MKTLTTEQELAYHAWWMSEEVPPDTKYKDELGGAEDQCRAAFLEGWGQSEGATIDGTVTPLKEALRAVDKRAMDERYGIQADRLSAIAAIAHAALNAEEATSCAHRR